jgi:hypothetical protein
MTPQTGGSVVKWLLLLIGAMIPCELHAQGFFTDKTFVVNKKFVPIEGMSGITINRRLDRLVVLGDLKEIAELDYDGNILRVLKLGLADFEEIKWLSGDEEGDWYALLCEAGPRFYWCHIPNSMWVKPQAVPKAFHVSECEMYEFPGGDVESFWVDLEHPDVFNVHAFRKNKNSPAYTRVIRDGRKPAHHVVDPCYGVEALVAADNYAVRSAFFDAEICANPIRLHQDSEGNYQLQEFDDSKGVVVSKSANLPLGKGEGLIFKDSTIGYCVADKTVGRQADNFYIIQAQ